MVNRPEVILPQAPEPDGRGATGESRADADRPNAPQVEAELPPVPAPPPAESGGGTGDTHAEESPEPQASAEVEPASSGPQDFVTAARGHDNDIVPEEQPEHPDGPESVVSEPQRSEDGTDSEGRGENTDHESQVEKESTVSEQHEFGDSAVDSGSDPEGDNDSESSQAGVEENIRPKRTPLSPRARVCLHSTQSHLSIRSYSLHLIEGAKQ